MRLCVCMCTTLCFDPPPPLSLAPMPPLFISFFFFISPADVVANTCQHMHTCPFSDSQCTVLTWTTSGCAVMDRFPREPKPAGVKGEAHAICPRHSPEGASATHWHRPALRNEKGKPRRKEKGRERKRKAGALLQKQGWRVWLICPHKTKQNNLVTSSCFLVCFCVHLTVVRRRFSLGTWCTARCKLPCVADSLMTETTTETSAWTWPGP